MFVLTEIKSVTNWDPFRALVLEAGVSVVLKTTQLVLSLRFHVENVVDVVPWVVVPMNMLFEVNILLAEVRSLVPANKANILDIGF